MNIPIFCNRCDKHLKTSEEVTWITFSDKYPNSLDEKGSTPSIYPLCKECSLKAKKFVMPMELNGE